MNARRARRAVAVAKGREKILQRWHAALAARGAASKDQATDKFRTKLAAEGATVSRGTLYEWEARQIAGGLEGLVDGRCDPKREALAKAKPELLTFNLPGGVRLNMRLASRSTVDVRQAESGMYVDIRPGEEPVRDGASKAL
jgi:hypothetical protein